MTRTTEIIATGEHDGAAKEADVCRYYAKAGTVWKAPVATDKPGGGLTISIGFPVCTMHPAVGDDAAASVAELMNAGMDALAARLHRPSTAPDEAA